MTQCPLSQIACCCLTPKFILGALGFLGLGVGALSVLGPRRSITLYQWIMERFNWKVVPIDEAREVRNTRVLGVCLTLLSLAIFVIMLLKF